MTTREAPKIVIPSSIEKLIMKVDVNAAVEMIDINISASKRLRRDLVDAKVGAVERSNRELHTSFPRREARKQLAKR